MVKTVRGTVELETLRDRLTEHCQKLPSYRRVESDTIEVRFFSDHIRLELREQEPTKQKCWHCEGTGKDYDYDYGEEGEGKKVPNDDLCPMCDGTGERYVHHTTVARLVKKDHKSGAKVAIEVDTQGTKLEVWKPAVERIKKFLEELVGEPFVQVRLTKAEEVASRPPLMAMIEQTVEGL